MSSPKIEEKIEEEEEDIYDDDDGKFHENSLSLSFN
jgi:hypothetical protein